MFMLPWLLESGDLSYRDQIPKQSAKRNELWNIPRQSQRILVTAVLLGELRRPSALSANDLDEDPGRPANLLEEALEVFHVLFVQTTVWRQGNVSGCPIAPSSRVPGGQNSLALVSCICSAGVCTSAHINIRSQLLVMAGRQMLHLAICGILLPSARRYDFAHGTQTVEVRLRPT
mmetsp:Transcript_35931/g.74774  ORF Transcript_35931/g.74774 Transcript_35931/m.74774 type:complete len:175 (+) Transcript_35931:16-540(+)